MTVPYMPNHRADAEWDAYDPSIQSSADALAWSALHYLSGGRVGNSRVLLRPCAARCGSGLWEPTIRDGEWYNSAGCGHTAQDCSCTNLSSITLPTEVAEILNVWEDGILLIENVDYRAYNGNTVLVRVGDAWPACQDYAVAHDAVGALTVEYVPGIYPSEAGLLAAGALASEFAKAITGAKCKLPSAITSLTRNGISLDFQEGYFPNNVTGMLVVDSFVASLNPNGLRQAARVWSPDIPVGMSQAAPGA